MTRIETEAPSMTAGSDFLVGKTSHAVISFPSRRVTVTGIDGGTPMGAELTFDDQLGIGIRCDGRGRRSRDKTGKVKAELQAMR